MKEKILKIISAIAKLEVDYLKNNIDTPNLWASMSHIEIIIALEEEFDVQFNQEEIAQMVTISKIFKITEGKLS